MKINVTLLFVIIFSFNTQLFGQKKSNNRISVSLIQLQPNSSSKIFVIDPILLLGLGYERTLKQNFGIVANIYYKRGEVESRLSSGSRANADLSEVNFKLGLIRYFNLSDRLNIPVKFQYFYEHSNYENNMKNFIIVGADYDNEYFNEEKFQGFEIGYGLELQVNNKLKIFGLSGIQIGKIKEVDSFGRGRVLVNLPIVEELGVKYVF